jgi:hypothetical protein
VFDGTAETIVISLSPELMLDVMAVMAKIYDDG